MNTRKRRLGEARHKAAALTLGACTVVLAACGSSSAPSAASKPSTTQALTTVRISQYAGTENSWLTWVADHEGFYKKNGINPTLVSVSSGAEDAPALVSGSVDVVNMDLLLAAPTLLDKGQKLTVISGAFLNPWSVIVRKGVVPSATLAKGFPYTIRALAGKKVAIVALASVSQFLLDDLESAAGMPSGSITMVPAEANGAGLAALESNQVDGAMYIPPANYVGQQNGYDTIFSFINKPSAKLVKEYPKLTSVMGTTDGSMWSTQSWAASHPTLVTDFRQAMVQASAWMHDPANLSKVVAVLSEKGMGLPYSGTQAVAYVKAELPDIVSYYTQQSAQAWTTFGTQTKLLNSGIPYTDWWSPKVPQS